MGRRSFFFKDYVAAADIVKSGALGNMYFADLHLVRRLGIPKWGMFHMAKENIGGAFCDIGCGASGLLGLRNLCVSRLTHPGDLLRVGQRLPVLIQSLDPARRRVALTLQELLGTWEENAARFRPGQSVPGVVCGKTDYGVFIALTPNLCGLAERDDTLEPGQPVCVYIKAIHPETLKLKLTVLHRLDALPPQPLPFTKTQGRLDVWRYGSREHAKNVTVF